MFILPLVIIFVLVFYGTTSKQLTGFFQANADLVKLLTAILFAGLGGWLLFTMIGCLTVSQARSAGFPLQSSTTRTSAQSADDLRFGRDSQRLASNATSTGAISDSPVLLAPRHTRFTVQPPNARGNSTAAAVLEAVAMRVNWLSWQEPRRGARWVLLDLLTS